MTLEFSRECIIINGLPTLGTITVEIEAEFDFDGLGAIYPVCTGFEPEDARQGLLWASVEGPCEAWLAANKGRVEKRTLGKIAER